MGKAEKLKTEMLKAESGGRGTEDGVEEFYLEYCLPRKVELSLAYAARANVWTDILIILRTLFPFFEAKGKGKAEIWKAESRSGEDQKGKAEMLKGVDAPASVSPASDAP